MILYYPIFQPKAAVKEVSSKAAADPLSDPQSISPDFYNEEVLVNSASTNTLDRNSLSNKLPPISPYAVKPNNSLPLGGTGNVKPNKQGKIPPPIASKPGTIKRGDRTPGNSFTQTRGEVISCAIYRCVYLEYSRPSMRGPHTVSCV